MRCWCTLKELAVSPSLEFFNVTNMKGEKGKGTAQNNFFNKKGMLSPVSALSHTASQASAPSFWAATSLPADIITIHSKSKAVAACIGSLSWWIHHEKFYSIFSLYSNVFTHSFTFSFLCVHSTKAGKR